MFASSSRSGYALLSRPSEESEHLVPSSASTSSAPGAKVLNVYITTLLRVFASLFSIISIVLYLVQLTVKRDYYNPDPALIVSLVPLFLSLGVHLILGLCHFNGKHIKVHFRLISSTTGTRNERSEGGKGERINLLPLWDLAIGLTSCVTASITCTSVHSRTLVIVGVVFNFCTA